MTTNYSNTVTCQVITITTQIYRYEDFIEGRHGDLESHLGLSLSCDPRPDAGGRLERVRRSARTGEWRNWFLQQDVDIFKARHGRYMARFGYDGWERPPAPHIRRETSLDYVRGIARKMRLFDNLQPASGPGGEPPGYSGTEERALVPKVSAMDARVTGGAGVALMEIAVRTTAGTGCVIVRPGTSYRLGYRLLVPSGDRYRVSVFLMSEKRQVLASFALGVPPLPSGPDGDREREVSREVDFSYPGAVGTHYVNLAVFPWEGGPPLLTATHCLLLLATDCAFPEPA